VIDYFAFDPATDLEFSRVIAARPETVWRCLTEAALLQEWFCPKPWQAHDVVIEPRPGGRMFTPMRGPDGEAVPGADGCILVAEPGRALAFTDAMGPGFHPKAEGFMTGVYLLAPSEAGTRLTARALHASAADRDTHAGMGFHQGWGTAVDQLAALAEGL
jgi:uncharacterized protein YndB with AHSA1/START domain